MNRKKDVVLAALAVIAICLMMAFMSGCVEEERTSKVWGDGELPADFISFFGTDNGARLDKAQNDMLNRHQAVIHGVDQTEGDKKKHIPGLVDIVMALDRRVKALEAVDPNEVAK